MEIGFFGRKKGGRFKLSVDRLSTQRGRDNGSAETPTF